MKHRLADKQNYRSGHPQKVGRFSAHLDKLQTMMLGRGSVPWIHGLRSSLIGKEHWAWLGVHEIRSNNGNKVQIIRLDSRLLSIETIHMNMSGLWHPSDHCPVRQWRTKNVPQSTTKKGVLNRASNLRVVVSQDLFHGEQRVDYDQNTDEIIGRVFCSDWSAAPEISRIWGVSPSLMLLTMWALRKCRLASLIIGSNS